ncbi:MAG: hypothetical protein C0614_05525 [Desulfuromonas sp.]|nr:MAG: hypothetical protein C0614_05525 [Desulfuromonas sp.]
MASRVLLAEDNLQLAQSVLQLLGRQGLIAEHQADGVSALKSIASNPPDLLLLDLNLPGLHGIELLKKLRQSPRTAALPVVIITGAYKGEKYHQAARHLGVSHYLEKPFKSGALRQAIAEALPLQAAVAGEKQRPFAHHLREVFLKELCGQMVFSHGGNSHTLSFIKGIPVGIGRGFQHSDLGAYLRSKDYLSAAEYGYYRSRPAENRTLPVQLGCLDYHALLQAELDYLEHELLQAFSLPPMASRWIPFELPSEVCPLSINMPQLFYDGFHSSSREAGATLLRNYGQRFVAATEGYFRYINFMSLREQEKQFIEQLDGQSRLGTLLPGDFDGAPLVLTLASLNMIRFSEEPAAAVSAGDLPIRVMFNACVEEFEVDIEESLESFTDLTSADEEAVDAIAAVVRSGELPAAQDSGDLGQEVRLLAKSLEGQNHYQVFGIKPAKFSIDLLKERYFAITRRFGPDILMQLGGEEAQLVEQILSIVATAYDTLSDVVKKERYDELLGSDKVGLGREGDDRFQAEVQAESGKVFLEMEEWDNAEKALQEAVNFDPNNGDYLASLAWATYRNPRYSNSSAMQTKAKQMLNKALVMERFPQGFAYKGWILLESGQETMAEAEFSKALKLDARHVLARKGMRALQEKREQQKRGLFKRMFK